MLLCFQIDLMLCTENHPKDETICAGFYFVGFKKTLNISFINQNINNPRAMLFFVVATTNIQHLFSASKPNRKASIKLAQVRIWHCSVQVWLSNVIFSYSRDVYLLSQFFHPDPWAGTCICHLCPKQGTAKQSQELRNSWLPQSIQAEMLECNKLLYVTNGDGGTHGPN